MKHTVLMAMALCLLITSVYGQGERGALNGTVTDTSGAVVPGVDVRATHTETNVEYKAVTTEAGVYRLPYLPLGTYKITFSVSGFRTGVSENIQLRVAQTLTVDHTLTVGQVTEQMTVSAETPPIETGSSEIGRYVSRQEFATLPVTVSGGRRQLQSFIFRSLPGTTGNDYGGSINGGQQFSHEILIEGMSIGRFDLAGGANTEFSPSPEAVSEFKLQTGTMGAQYGGGESAVANFAFKSGTNELHGSAYSYLLNDVLNANGFSGNARGIPRAPRKLLNYGLSAGGPVEIPKLYSGRNRTFFFVSYEHTRERNFQSLSLGTLPTREFRSGDFSRLLDSAYTGNSKSGSVVGADALGRPVVFGQIYDPLSTRSVSGKVVRDIFPNNIIPQNRWSQVSSNIVEQAYLDDPINDKLLNNIPMNAASSPIMDEAMFSVKGDHQISTNHRLSAFFTYGHPTNWFIKWGKLMESGGGTAGLNSPVLQDKPGRMVRLAEDWTVSPSIINHFAVGYNRFGNHKRSVSAGYDWPGKIGLTNTASSTFPWLSFSGQALLGGGVGWNGTLAESQLRESFNGSTIFQDDLTIIRGTHSLRTGFEFRFYYYNVRQYSTTGTFEFNSLQTQLPGFSDSTGHAWASFLLGAVNSTSRSIIASNPGFRTRVPAFYFSDDWKASKKLTLNLGIRWEIIGGYYEVAGRLTNLDLKKPNPAAGGLPGALVFADELNNTGFQETNWRQISPRLGLAYAFNPKLVLRAGYGLNNMAPTSGFKGASMLGYNGSISVNAGNTPLPFQQDPVLYWDQGYPSFTGTLPNKDPSLANNQGMTYINPKGNELGILQNYNVGIQYGLPAQFVLEASYIGSKGTRLWAYGLDQLNQLPVSALQYGDALIQPLSTNPQLAPVPFPGFKSTLAQAMRPFPQYQSIGQYMPNTGKSWYNSLQLTATRHFTKGFSLMAAYTFSKLLTNVVSNGQSWAAQDVYNPLLEKSVAEYNPPQYFKLSWIYELPIGSGKPVDLGRIGNAVVGGWTVTGIHAYRSGDPLSVGTSGLRSDAIFNGAYRPDVISGVPQIQDEGGPLKFGTGTAYLNPAAFAQVPRTANGVPLRLGMAPRVLDIRGPHYASEDFGIKKAFRFCEQCSLEFRADAFNAFNRAGRGNPSTDVTSPLFGKITGPQQGPRSVMLSLRVNF